MYLLLTARRSRRNSVTDGGAPGPARFTRIAAYLSLGVLAAAGWRGGATMRFTGDGPDHVGTIREILASGSFFPTEAFHVGAGILGADPRKGLLHPVYAALCTISGLDPVDLWTLLPIVTAPFLFAAGYLFLRGISEFVPRCRWRARGSFCSRGTTVSAAGSSASRPSPTRSARECTGPRRDRCSSR